MRRIICYDHNTMSKIRLWDTNKNKTEDESRPFSSRPAQSVGQTVTTADYFNSPLAKNLGGRQTSTPVEGLKISSPISNPTSDFIENTEEVGSEEPFETVQKYKVLKRKQRRRQAVSISVSEEEEDLLRQGAAAEGMTFSAWARKHLFRAMKTSIPKRPDS